MNGHGSIWITTNKGIENWRERFASDEAFETAVLNRLLHKRHMLDITGSADRLRDL